VWTRAAEPSFQKIERHSLSYAQRKILCEQTGLRVAGGGWPGFAEQSPGEARSSTSKADGYWSGGGVKQARRSTEHDPKSRGHPPIVP
jgi:hypothetical protein